MIDYAYKDLFMQDSIHKNLIVNVDGALIENTSFYSESFELLECLCSSSELRFGSCEASVVKFKIRNEFGELKNKWMDIAVVLNGYIEEPFAFGRYKVHSSKPSGNKKYTNITAYDAMYDIINAEMVEWYDSLVFPMTMRDFRNSFFEYLGLEQVEIELINDDILVEKTIDADSISGKQIITAICELNGVFGHINRQGLFDYVSLPKRTKELYPSLTLYPSNSTFPINAYRGTQEYSQNRYRSCTYEDFETSGITKLQIRQEENDIGAVYGEGTNTYIVQDNFLVYGKSAEELEVIAQNLYNKISGVYYRPFKAELRGNPCVEVGDFIIIHAKQKTVESYVLERTIKGIQSLKDTFESNGVYEYKEKVNSKNKDIKILKRKTNILTRTVEKLISLITDEETGLQSQIEQTAEKVEAKVSKGEVSAQLSIELGKILLKGNRIAIKSDYFELNEDGSIKAKNGEFTGTFKQYNSNGVQSIAIDNNQIKVYAWHDDGNYAGSFGALRRVDSNDAIRTLVSMWCDYEDILTLNYVSPTDPNSTKSVISFDPVDMENGHTPWIKNTSSGTLFANNPSGGIVVENGLIKTWNMSGSTSTIFPNNPGGGIVLNNGLVTSWNLQAATGKLFGNNPSGGIDVVNGLITNWSLSRVADSKLSFVSDVILDWEGYVTGLTLTDVVIKDGLITATTERSVWANGEGGWTT